MRRFWYVPAAIILVLLVAAFLAGWLQLALPADTFGVVYTRGRGFDPAVVKPGGFTWRWQRLLPKTLVLHRFTLAPRLAELPVSGILASGAVYAALVPEKPDFSYELHVTVRYRVRPEALPRLAEQDGLRPEGLGGMVPHRRRRPRPPGRRRPRSPRPRPTPPGWPPISSRTCPPAFPTSSCSTWSPR